MTIFFGPKRQKAASPRENSLYDPATCITLLSPSMMEKYRTQKGASQYENLAIAPQKFSSGA